MTREELIEQRKDMTNEEVIKAVIGKMAESYRVVYEDSRAEYRMLKREGADEDAISDARILMRDFAMKRNLLEGLLSTLDARCSAYVNGIEY